MGDKITSVGELIDYIGGPAALGRAIGVSTEHASVMKQRKSIPVARWSALIASEAGKIHRITSDVLLRIHAPQSDEAA